MIFQVKTVKNIPTLVVTDGDVTCKLVLDPKCHEIVTKCEDTKDLANRVSYAYRECFGNGTTGVAMLKAIKKKLVEGSKKS